MKKWPTFMFILLSQVLLGCHSKNEAEEAKERIRETNVWYAVLSRPHLDAIVVVAAKHGLTTATTEAAVRAFSAGRDSLTNNILEMMHEPPLVKTDTRLQWAEQVRSIVRDTCARYGLDEQTAASIYFDYYLMRSKEEP